MADLWIYITAVLTLPLVYIASQLLRFARYLYQLRKITKVVSKFATEDYHWFGGHVGLLPDPTSVSEANMMVIFEMSKKSKTGACALMFPLNPMFSVFHPDTVKVILNTAEPKGFITASGSGYKFLHPWLGQGLLTASGKKWHRNRKLLTPAFHFEILKQYTVSYNECVKIMMSKIKTQSEKDDSLEIFEPISLCTLNILLKCAFSCHDDVQNLGSMSTYVKTGTDLKKLLMERLFEPHTFIDTIYAMTFKGKQFFKLCDQSHNTALKVITARRKELASKDQNPQNKEAKAASRYLDFVDILLLAKDENGEGLTDKEIQDEVETFMFAGHDTTTSAISWLLYNLSRHPDIQQQAYDEVSSVLGNGRETIEWEDLGKLKYLTMCIKESMRLVPPVPGGHRELTKPPFIAGEEIPAGTIIDININNLHHNPSVWGQDHMTYKPERFHPDNLTKMDSHAFVPFMAGPRNCIGQVFALNEIKTLVAQILRKFELSADATHPVKMWSETTIRAENGIKLHFKLRT